MNITRRGPGGKIDKGGNARRRVVVLQRALRRIADGQYSLFLFSLFSFLFFFAFRLRHTRRSSEEREGGIRFLARVDLHEDGKLRVYGRRNIEPRDKEDYTSGRR